MEDMGGMVPGVPYEEKRSLATWIQHVDNKETGRCKIIVFLISLPPYYWKYSTQVVFF